jgi:hypothetical protein
MRHLFLLILAATFSFNCAHLSGPEKVYLGMNTGQLVVSPITSECFYVRDEFDNVTQSANRYIDKTECLEGYLTFNLRYDNAKTYWYVKRDIMSPSCHQYCRTDVRRNTYSSRERSLEFSLRARVEVSCEEYPPEKYPEPDLGKDN